MPWKVLMKQNIRREFAVKALAPGANLTALCLEYDVTRKTGREWRERARLGGINRLAERSRRPLSSPQQLSEATVCQVVRLKVAYPHWGPKKISELYRKAQGEPIGISSCHRVLKAAGLVEPRKRRVRRAATLVLGPVVPRAANDVWTIDFKGWWRLGDGCRCEPLTVRDAFSKYILAAVVPANGRTQTMLQEFNRLFQLYGLPKVIKSDNGTPFATVAAPLGLSVLSASWVALGIELEHSRPGHPQDNGAHERMHKDIVAEVATKVQVDARAQQVALDLWRREYNEVRPHETLRGRCPAELYSKSPRCYPAKLAGLDYGPGYFPRKVSARGVVKYNGRSTFITTALAGWEVGLRIESANAVQVWFNYLLVGTIDLQTNRFGSAPSRSAKAVGLAA
ncbi:MAG: Integrase catalytic region [Pedosphaera sp.]|nr:Integrase catalytic region [Pedosphaera sp.]